MKPTPTKRKHYNVATPAYLRTMPKEVLVQTIIRLRNRFRDLNTRIAAVEKATRHLPKPKRSRHA